MARLVSCTQFDTSQAAQDAAIAALQATIAGLGGVTPQNVLTAIQGMTAAEKAAACAAFSCPITTAALSAALLGLQGSGVAGNVLTIVGGVPTWQALPAVAGTQLISATPSTSTTAAATPSFVNQAIAAIPPSVTLTNTAPSTSSTTAATPAFVNAAIAAIPTGASTPVATDTVQGISALNLGQTNPDTTNATDALTANGFNRMANSDGAVGSPDRGNAVQVACAYAITVASVRGYTGQNYPTFLPTAADPDLIATNDNYETWLYVERSGQLAQQPYANGPNGWVLAGNGYRQNLSLTNYATVPTEVSTGTGADLASFTMPRAGQVLITANITYVNQVPAPLSNPIPAASVAAGVYAQINSRIRNNGVLLAREATRLLIDSNELFEAQSLTYVANVLAGDVISLSYVYSVTGGAVYNFAEQHSLQVTYIA